MRSLLILDVDPQNLSNQLTAISMSLAPLTALLPLLTQLLQTPSRPIDPPRSTTEQIPDSRSPRKTDALKPPPCTQPPHSRTSSLSSSIDSRTNALKHSGGKSVAGSSGSRTFSTQSLGRPATRVAPIPEEPQSSLTGVSTSTVLPRSTISLTEPTSSFNPTTVIPGIPSSSPPSGRPQHFDFTTLAGPCSDLPSPNTNLRGPSPHLPAILATHTQPLPGAPTPPTSQPLPTSYPASAPQQIPAKPSPPELQFAPQLQFPVFAPPQKGGPRSASKKRRRIEQSDTEDEHEAVERRVERKGVSSRKSVIEQEGSQQSQVCGEAEMEVDEVVGQDGEEEEPVTEEEEEE